MLYQMRTLSNACFIKCMLYQMCALPNASGLQKNTFGLDLVPLKFRVTSVNALCWNAITTYTMVLVVSILKQIEQLSKCYHFGMKLPLKLLFLEVILDLQKNGP